MPIESIFLLALWGTAVGLTLWGTWYSLSKLKERPVRVSLPGLPPVSILKPLKGAEAGIRENLETFFRLDYPEYELIFSIASSADPARSVVESLLRRFPGVPARLIIGSQEIGPNPKVNNLLRSYYEAKHDVLLISDSNVRVAPDYLRRNVAHLRPGVGLVTAVVAGRGEEGVGGSLEAAYLNTFYARWMQIASAFGVPVVIGKSMLFRRSTAERFGGITNLSRYIAEDYMAGQAMKRLGLRVAIMRDPVRQHIGYHRLQAFWSRHIRWGRIRKAQAPLAFAFEPWMGPILSGVLGAIGMEHWLGFPFAFFFVGHLLVWFACDFALMRRLGDGPAWRAPLSWVAREVLALPLWVQIASGNAIDWRGNRLRILPGGLLAADRLSGSTSDSLAGAVRTEVGPVLAPR